MQIDIQARNFTLTEALHQYVKRRLAFVLDTWNDDIQRIQVRLSDTNGPRGGVDKRCLIRIDLNRKPSIVIKDTEENMYAAIDLATDRASRAVSRKLMRRRNYRRLTLRHLELATI
jgi:ribosomal subunit interface protein